MHIGWFQSDVVFDPKIKKQTKVHTKTREWYTLTHTNSESRCSTGGGQHDL